MGSLTKNDDRKNAMADEETTKGGEAEKSGLPLEVSSSGGRPPRELVVSTSGGGKTSPGFFTIHKSGQGYWTRMGTVLGAALVALLTSQFLYIQARTWFLDASNHPRMSLVLAVVVIFLAVYSYFVYRLINKPRVVDFLIATDSEMKKVNWTTRRELIGSTKVVIVFMILIALILFGFDTFFGYFFWLIGVLQVNPFSAG